MAEVLSLGNKSILFVSSKRAFVAAEYDVEAVVDISGSMGSLVGPLISVGIPTLLERMGFTDDRSVGLTTFESKSQRTVLTIKGLRDSHYRALGGTTMTPAWDIIIKALDPASPRKTLVLLFSDGAIDDFNTIFLRAKAAHSYTGVRTLLVRIGTGADTRALAAWSVLDGSGASLPPVDVGRSVDDMLQKIDLEALRLSKPMVVAQGLSHDAGAGRSFQSLTVNDQGFLFVQGKPQTILVDGEEVNVSDVQLTSELLQRVVAGLDARLRSRLLVFGNQEISAEINQAAQVVESLEQALSSKFAEATSVNEIRELSPIAARFEHIKRTLEKRKAGAGARLRNLANIDMVELYRNAQGAADFLRGNLDASKATARRAVKRAEISVEDLPGAVSLELEELAKHLKSNPLPPIDSHDVSFFSQADLRSCFEELAEIGDFSSLTLEEMLSLIGPMGLPFVRNGAPNPAPDPFAGLDIKRVSLAYKLLSSDLIAARVQGKGSDLILPDSSEREPVDGVIPIPSLDPEAHALLVKFAPTLLKCHSAIAVRGQLLPIPGDSTALWTLGAVNVARQISENDSEAARNTLQLLRNNSPRYNLEFDRSAFNLDPSAYLVGDMNVTTSHLPLGWLLAGTVVPTQKLLRAIVAMEIRKTLKFVDQEKVTQAILRILEFDKAKLPGVGAPFEPDPSVSSVPRSFPNGAFVALFREFDSKFAPIVETVAKLVGFEARDSAFGERYEEVFGLATWFFGQKVDAKLEDIIERTDSSRKSLRPDPTPEEIDEACGNAVQQMYLVEFKVLIAKKRAEEAVLWQKRMEENAAGVPDVASEDETFMELFSQRFMNKQWFLGNLNSIEFLKTLQPRRLRWFLLRSVPPELPKIAFGPKMGMDALVLFKDKYSEQEWDEIVQQFIANSKHEYRPAGVNRHGHSNDLPSWWARGFNSMREFKFSEPEEFEEYVQERLNVLQTRSPKNAAKLRKYLSTVK